MTKQINLRDNLQKHTSSEEEAREHFDGLEWQERTSDRLALSIVF